VQRTIPEPWKNDEVVPRIVKLRARELRFEERVPEVPKLKPIAIDFLKSVGFGIGFCLNVGFQSGSVSVSGLKKVISFCRIFYIFFCFDGHLTVLIW
jgi:hypothetical protein